MIFIGARSCDYQSFGQIYVRQLGGKLHLGGRVAKVSVCAQFMDGVIIRASVLRFYYRPSSSRQIITHGNRRRLITMIG